MNYVRNAINTWWVASVSWRIYLLASCEHKSAKKCHHVQRIMVSMKNFAKHFIELKREDNQSVGLEQSLRPSAPFTFVFMRFN